MGFIYLFIFKSWLGPENVEVGFFFVVVEGKRTLQKTKTKKKHKTNKHIYITRVNVYLVRTIVMKTSLQFFKNGILHFTFNFQLI